MRTSKFKEIGEKLDDINFKIEELKENRNKVESTHKCDYDEEEFLDF